MQTYSVYRGVWGYHPAFVADYFGEVGYPEATMANSASAQADSPPLLHQHIHHQPPPVQYVIDLYMDLTKI